jgi:hypothetical protein
MTGYFFGILANAMLILGITSAVNKVTFSNQLKPKPFKLVIVSHFQDNFFFFRIYYIASIWLTIVTMIQGVQLDLLPFIFFSLLNLIFLFAIAVIQRRLMRERRETFQFQVMQ